MWRNPRVILEDIRMAAGKIANRIKGGKDTKALDNAFLRPSGCRIKTDIRAGGTCLTWVFGPVEEADIKRKFGWGG